MKKKNNKQPRPARRAILIRFSVPILACWLLVCSFLTFYVADDMCHQMDDLLEYFSQKAYDVRVSADHLYPGKGEFDFLASAPAAFTKDIQRCTPFMLRPYYDNFTNRLVDIYEPFFVLGSWWKGAGAKYITSESFVVFEYEVISGSREDGATDGYGFASDFGVDVWRSSDVGVPSKLQSNVYWNEPFDCLRGYFIGNQFFLSDSAPEGISLVEIDVTYFEGHYTYEYDPVVIGGEKYSSVIDYAISTDELSALNNYHAAGNLIEKIIVRADWTRDGSYVYYVGYRFHPLRYAIMRLLPFILITFVLAIKAIELLTNNVHHRLLHPIHQILYKQDAGIHSDQFWQEAKMLKEQFGQLQQQLAEANTENQRLNKALDYARDAEENRRQLVSNLTHELKTPLAVIHSYAEGLQENIAEEKRDRYLSVITEESERMDTMVLEMLDLSRLEAGKVRLAAEQFSLLAAAKAVTDKFAPMLEAKDLTLTYDLEEDLTVTADEGRITQVITNLVSNAFKYAPKGSTIRVRVGHHSESSAFHIRTANSSKAVSFSIENEAEHLSEEKLAKVWDSFYRTDPSRTEPGTGLGLAIVKSIIELHRGSCFARNTLHNSADSIETDVEFGFCLPIE